MVAALATGVAGLRAADLGLSATRVRPGVAAVAALWTAVQALLLVTGALGA